MNKIIFQIGILGFCVSAVVFGGGSGSVIDVIARSFIVFVGIVLAAAAIVIVAGTMRDHDYIEQEPEKNRESSPTQQTQQ